QMPLRQAASCIPAMQMLLQETEPLFVEDVGEDAEAGLGEGDEAVIGVDIAEELSALDVLRRPLTVDTKYEELVAALRQARAAGLQQMMIFSFFRRTLK